MAVSLAGVQPSAEHRVSQQGAGKLHLRECANLLHARRADRRTLVLCKQLRDLPVSADRRGPEPVLASELDSYVGIVKRAHHILFELWGYRRNYSSIKP